MKLRHRLPEATKVGERRRLGGFTLAELTVTMAVSMLVMAGIITTYLFGLKLLEFTRPKLTASDHVRQTVGLMMTELRAAATVTVGQGGFNSFTPVADGARQEANAIKVVPASATNTYCIYYRDAADRSLKRATNGATRAEVLANCVSNNIVFTSENFGGQVLTNNHANRVIGMRLELQQTNYLTKVGTEQFYDHYEIRTKITKRTLK